MKRLFVAILVISILLTGSTSCKQVTTTVDAMTFDTLMVDTICPLFKNYPQPACHVSVKLAYPVQDTPSDLQQSFMRFVVSLPDEGGFDDEESSTFNDLARGYVRNYLLDYLRQGPVAIDSYGEDMDAAASWMNYQESVDGSVVYNAHGIVCYRLHTVSYTGGAHDFTSTKVGLYDIAHQRQIDITDIFSETQLPEVNRLIQQQLMEQFDCATPEQLSETVLICPVSEVELSDACLISEAGITWVYAPYSIAPYSVGEISVLVPWQQLRPYMLSSSPLSPLFN